MTVVCYGLQMLFEKERVTREEGREFTLRQEQLNSAGRLAAEIAHQIKNPLAIINNAAFNLQRALPQEKDSVRSQIQIIREEVERADRVLTELMGYSKLSDARVERLDLTEELERAIGQVLPAGSYETNVVRHFPQQLPPLMMQRGHLSEIFVNILTNAREAMQGHGQIEIHCKLNEPNSIEVVISDNGPGIPADKLERIFEAYYTTKTKGTGLGLAIVRHSMDIYGGKVEVQSELGKGSRFILHFPIKLLNVVT
jgi:signal transduction histidine kinase